MISKENIRKLAFFNVHADEKFLSDIEEHLSSNEKCTLSFIRNATGKLKTNERGNEKVTADRYGFI